MKIILIYVSLNPINWQFIKNNFKNIEKMHCETFDLYKLKETIMKYDYLIYLNDDTNYNYGNLINDINNGVNIINSNNEIQQLSFDNYICTNIDANILNQDKTYITNEIKIFKEPMPETIPKYRSEINYINYVNSNFNRLFMPSLIKINIFVNYDEILVNNPHYELIFLKKNNIIRHILNTKNILVFNKSKYIANINNELTIVTGYIKLNEKKIQKYASQTYEYLDCCIDTLKINVNMVIYVSEELRDFVYKKREEYGLLNKTKIINVDIAKHMYFHDKINIIEENVKKNHEAYSSAKKILSVVSRYNYLKDTIDNNYFDTKYIAWLDFGASHIVTIPNDIIFNDNFDNKIRIGWIAKYHHEQFNYNHKALSGGFYIGKKDTMIELIKLHNYYFNLLMNYGYTINDDKLLFFIFESNPFLFKTYFTAYKNIIVKL
jgi:hypothetical protein